MCGINPFVAGNKPMYRLKILSADVHVASEKKAVASELLEDIEEMILHYV